MRTSQTSTHSINKAYSSLNGVKKTSSGTTKSTSKASSHTTSKTSSTVNKKPTAVVNYSKQAAESYFKGHDKDKSLALDRDEVTLSAEAFAKLDADSDGKISQSELQKGLASRESLVAAYYRSGGAKTHAKDVVATAYASNAGGPSTVFSQRAAASYMKANDRDGDGLIYRDETALSPDLFAKLDANADGKLNRAEVEKALAGKESALAAYYIAGGEKAHDKDALSTALGASNASGNVGSYASMAAAHFLKDKDKSGDGQLSAGEAGLSAAAFKHVDANGDGKLSEAELNTSLTAKNSLIQRYYKNGGSKSFTNYASTLLKSI